MLNAPKWATIAGMRGEVGISTVRSRLARGRIQYARRVEQGDNKMLRRIMRSGREGRRSDWWEDTRRCLEWAQIGEDELSVVSGSEVKRRVAGKVEEEWRMELEMKSSLQLYRKFKLKMREEDYGGGIEAKVWFAARTNCMMLGDRRWGEGRECRMCGYEKEDQMHFILDCEWMEQYRQDAVELQRPRGPDREETLGCFLFGEESEVERRGVVLRMWRAREGMMNMEE